MRFYKGTGETIKGKCEITLHNQEYYENFNFQITPIGAHEDFYTTEVKDGKFVIYGEGKFYWFVSCETKRDDSTFYSEWGY
jgi:hypothetical protein